MKFTHVFRVRASLEAVAAFHQDPGSMALITPPPIVIRYQKAPARLVDGAEIHFTMWFGLLPIRWVARIDHVSVNGFVDKQLRGPFASWTHRHTFKPIDGQFTEVLDEVEVHLRRHLVWGLVGLGMWLGLPILFAFRAWKTRRVIRNKYEVS